MLALEKVGIDAEVNEPSVKGNVIAAGLSWKVDEEFVYQHDVLVVTAVLEKHMDAGPVWAA